MRERERFGATNPALRPYPTPTSAAQCTRDCNSWPTSLAYWQSTWVTYGLACRLRNITPNFFKIVAIETFPHHACPTAGRLAGAPERGEMALTQLHAPDRQYNAFLRCLSGEREVRTPRKQKPFIFSYLLLYMRVN